MRDVLDDEDRRIRPASLFALAAITVISFAVIYNSMFAQVGGRPFAGSGAPEGTTTRLQVDAGNPAANTIQLRYDPVVEDVQRELLASGYYKGMVDGVAGKRTRQAIQAFEQAAGLQVTGEPTAELVEHIRFTREIAEAALFTGTVEADPAAELRAKIRRVQTGLAELAYSPGEISGELTEQTRAAIKLFEHDRGLDQTGEISDQLMSELTKLSGQSDMSSN